MKKVTNIDRSKVMKAAWTSFNRFGGSFSQALKSAWSWAKRTILVEAPKSFRKWSPSAFMVRFYLESAYVQFKMFKGVATVTLEGISVETFEQMFCVFNKEKEFTNVHTFELNGVSYTHSFNC